MNLGSADISGWCGLDNQRYPLSRNPNREEENERSINGMNVHTILWL